VNALLSAKTLFGVVGSSASSVIRADETIATASRRVGFIFTNLQIVGKTRGCDIEGWSILLPLDFLWVAKSWHLSNKNVALPDTTV
jgi:hypothetical protein